MTPDQPERVIRADGWSYRIIAAALGVDHATVMRWMPKEDAGVPDGTPDQPERVIGKDGKSYAATTPKSTVWVQGRGWRNGEYCHVGSPAASDAGRSQVRRKFRSPHLTAGHQVS